MTDFVTRTMIVQDALVELARTLAAELSPAGEGMWIVGLSPTGEAPATHWVSSGAIDSIFGPLLTDAGALQEATGMDAEVCAQLVASSDVTDPDVVSPHERIAQLGLTFVES